MDRKTIHFLPLWLLATGLGACVDENSHLGHTLVDSSFYNVYVDTCTVDISTVLEDSIVTQGDSICQIGHCQDEAWGKVTATYYAEYSTVNFTPYEEYSYALDSLVLVMRQSGHYWGDTLTTPSSTYTAWKIPSSYPMTKHCTTAPCCPRKRPRHVPSPTAPAPARRKCRRYGCPTSGGNNCWTTW